MAFGNSQRQVETRRLGIELLQLQRDAFTDRACAASGRVETLHLAEYSLDLHDSTIDIRQQTLANLVQAVGEVAIVVDGIDHRTPDGMFTRLEARKLELP